MILTLLSSLAGKVLGRPCSQHGDTGPKRRSRQTQLCLGLWIVLPFQPLTGCDCRGETGGVPLSAKPPVAYIYLR